MKNLSDIKKILSINAINNLILHGKIFGVSSSSIHDINFANEAVKMLCSTIVGPTY